MFPEYRELITELKSAHDTHFIKLFDEHNALDDEITKLEQDPVQSSSLASNIETMKKRKLHLKDEVYRYLQKKAGK